MSDLDKIEAAVRSPTFVSYCQLIGSAIARAAMGDPTARQEIADLQKEQEQFIRSVIEAQS